MAIGLGTEGRRRAMDGGLLKDSRLWIALHTGDPTEAAPAEITASDYARQPVDPAGWTVDANGNGTNADQIAFGTAGSNWGNVTHMAAWSAQTGGSLVFDQTVTSAQNVESGEVVSFAAGAITVTFAVANT